MSGQDDFIAKFFGWMLMAVGVLIMGASGLCSAAMLFSGSMGTNLTMLPLVLIFGGVPFGVGFLFWFAGAALMPKKPWQTFAPPPSVDSDPPPPPPPAPPTKPPTVS